MEQKLDRTKVGQNQYFMGQKLSFFVPPKEVEQPWTKTVNDHFTHLKPKIKK